MIAPFVLEIFRLKFFASKDPHGPQFIAEMFSSRDWYSILKLKLQRDGQ